MIYIVALISIMLGSLAQYFLKTGMSHLNLDGQLSVGKICCSALTNPALIGGVFAYGLSLLFWLYVLSKLELSKAYPMVSLGYVFTMLIGYFILHEQVNFIRVVGLCLIVVGVVFITKS